MNEFDKCNFCISMTKNGCDDNMCTRRYHYRLDVNKILGKADDLNISVTDVLNLIRECNKQTEGDK
jgi:hypothetical protein